jgi:hypothetical protein
MAEVIGSTRIVPERLRSGIVASAVAPPRSFSLPICASLGWLGFGRGTARWYADEIISAFLLRRVTLDDVARITAEQLAELARFVDQVNPDVLQQILSMLA